jgi:hypothetical protein
MQTTLLLFVVGLLASTAWAQTTCFSSLDVSGPNSTQFNSVCQPTPLTPYCPIGASRCSPCDPTKSLEAQFCDCPAGSYCMPSAISSNYGQCLPFQMSGRVCTSPIQCFDAVGNYYWSCVGGFCRQCNQTFYGTQTRTCGGGSPYPASSRQGETRTCQSDGTWLGGGAISVQQGGSPTPAPAPPGSTTTPPSTTVARTSDATSARPSLVICASFALFLLMQNRRSA